MDLILREESRNCIALVTSKGVQREGNSDVLLEHALRDLGFRTSWRVWDDPDAHWNDTAAILIRKCWDYHLRYEEFVRWILWHKAHSRQLVNSHTALLWSSHKRYLLDLATNGIRIPESRILTERPTGGACIEEICESFGTHDLIIKPVVSASAYWTWRVPSVPFPVSTSRLDWLVARGGALIQRYLPEIQRDGEISLIFSGNRYLYAVQKSPSPGDFRTQPSLGATINLTEPSDAAYECAWAAYKQAPGRPCYGRVDVVDSKCGPYLMEVELIEPELFLDLHPLSASVIAKGIAEAVNA